MYLDIFISSAGVTMEETSEGTLLNLPGPRQAIVYAVQQSRDENGAFPFYHCLVTEEQFAQIKADNVPILPFQALNALNKNLFGGPAHVFNPVGIVYDDAGTKYVHKIKESEAIEYETNPL